MKIFMGVSQAMRDTFLFGVCMAMFALSAVAMWLADENTVRQMKEKFND